MKRILFILLIGSLASGVQLQAQELFEQLGGVKTNFVFTSADTEMDITCQFIIKSGEKKYQYSSESSYGYGYESHHLDFATSTPLSKIPKRKRFDGGYVITFLGADQNILAIHSLDDEYISIIENPDIENSLTFYSIDLIDIPISLIYQTKRINFVKIGK